MKLTKALLVPAIAASLLAALASPAAAEDVTILVAQINVNYIGRAPSTPDRIVGMVHVKDTNQVPIEGAEVQVTWAFDDADGVADPVEISASAVTMDRSGLATFELSPRGWGTYTITVDDVVKAPADLDLDSTPETSYLFDPSLGVTEGTLSLPW